MIVTLLELCCYAVFQRAVDCFSALEVCMVLYDTTAASSQEKAFSSVQVQELLGHISGICGVFSNKKTKYSPITNLLSYQFRLQENFERITFYFISFPFLLFICFSSILFYFETGSH